MNPITIGLIGFAILFVFLFVFGLPVGIGMALVGFAGLWCLVSESAAFAKLAIVPLQTVSSYDMAVFPLFMFMAHVLFVSGISRDLYDLVAKWLGRLPGGLAMATIGACAVFAAMSSSAIATAVTMGLVALPEMKRYNYQPELAIGAICLGAPLGILIPPSNVFITYALITETSIGKLFIAGIVPGVIAAVLYMITIYILCRRNPNLGPRGPSYSLREKIRAFGNSAEALGLVVLVLGGLMIGWFTPTEAGAVGAFGAIILSLIRRRLNWQGFRKALVETVKTTGMIYLIMIGAFIFNYFLAVTTIPFWLADFIKGLPVPPLIVMGCIIVMYLLLGTFMDELTMMLLTVPIFFPMVLALGFDPIWFGVIITKMVMMGGYSPPYGLVLFTVAGIAPDVPMGTIYKSVLPFVVADVVHVALLLFVPAVVLFLPSIMG